MRARKLTAIAAAAIGIAAGVLVPAPASAAVGPFVIWDQPGFTGPYATMTSDLLVYGNLVYQGTSTPINDSASSARNFAANHIVYAYRDPQKKPVIPCDVTVLHLLFLRSGQTSAQASWEYPNLATTGFDNKISGHCFT